MDLENELINIVGRDNCIKDEPMKDHTTFRTGGPAKYYVMPGSADELADIIKMCRRENAGYQIIGNGSNVLFADEGYDGVVIGIGGRMSNITMDGGTVTAQAGAKLSRLAAEAAEHSFEGLEFASGIPGTVGGAVVMNAGAYGGEIKDVIRTATVYDADSDRLFTLYSDELRLGYRSSIIQKTDYIVLEACFGLRQGIKNDIMEKMKDFNQRRRDKQPLSYASAGSTFKRPEGYYAGALIEECGLKGYRVNDAMVSEKHAGFVINTGNARTDDILSVIRHVQDTVYARRNVRLETEVKIISAGKNFRPLVDEKEINGVRILESDGR